MVPFQSNGDMEILGTGYRLQCIDSTDLSICTYSWKNTGDLLTYTYSSAMPQTHAVFGELAHYGFEFFSCTVTLMFAASS